MLIIFDLDDTLIDTSGCVTPFKMQECIRKFLSLGLPLPSFSEAYEELLAFNKASLKSVDAVSQFARRYGADDLLLDVALQELTTPLPEDFIVSLTPDAKEILEFFQKTHRLALVTGGHPPFQRDKLKKAGVDTSIFSMISIPENSVKKPSYEMLKNQFSLSSQEIWVCGDRIQMDLRPAFELGFHTVHMRWGRGASMESESWIEHSVTHLRQLKEIIK